MDIDNPLRSQNKNINVNRTSEGRISGYFCSNTFFNLIHKVMTETEIKVNETGLDHTLIEKKINE